ncbi:MAG: phosphate acyltransferase PlsX [Clostridia bacterium]|nr:phosphate acyltransferase PlsX [Clostridia bacterium]
MIILVDAMGGDNAPEAVVNGCIDAINELDGFDVMLLGDRDKIEKIIKERKFTNPRLKITHTSEVVTNEDAPTKAIKNKKDSSMVVGFNMLKQKKGDVLVSAGNTGALMTGALLILGRIKGVDRPALPAVIPTKTGGTLLIDAGSNTVCKPINYLQFGIMGSIYMKEVLSIESPKVGLINVGVEEKKGTEAVRQAYSLLSKSNINFVGNIEGRDVPEGMVHVAVCDGFVGNVILKFLEGVGSFFFSSLKEIYSKNIISKLSALAVKGGFRNFKKSLDYEEYGGVPLLGVNGRVFKCHGSSKAKSFKNAVKKAYIFAKSRVVEQMGEEFKNMEVEDIEQDN